MTALPCPLPQVEEALTPYIQTRQETQRIRKTLTEFFESQVSRATDAQPLSHVTLACPPAELGTKQTSNEIDGLRKRYLEALAAHNTARERYDALNAELNDMREARVYSGIKSTERISTTDGVQPYIELLYQRRRHRKLGVIRATLEKITDTDPNPTSIDLERLLKTTLGDAPAPPLAALNQKPLGSGADELTFRLKKELLKAKHSMDQENALRARTKQSLNGAQKPDIEAQIHGLRCARDELISWIESQLAKLSESGEDSEAQLGEEASELDLGDDEEISVETYQNRIQELYEKYVLARASLVSRINAGISETPRPSSPSKAYRSPSKPTTAEEGDNSLSCNAVDVLSYIPLLLQQSRDERSLLQQSTHLRHRLAAASDENLRSVRRLANESHLVAPPSTSALAWAAAAEETSSGTEAYVKENLEVGEKSVHGANDILAELRARREAFGRITGSV